MFEWKNHNKVDHPHFFMEWMVELSSLFNCLSGATWKKIPFIAFAKILPQSYAIWMCRVFCEATYECMWLYVYFFFIEKQSWSLDIFACTVSFDLSKLFYCLRQVLIHFVLNVCFSSNHILQISLAFSKREMSWLCWILKKWKLLGYCMNLLLDLLNFEWKKNMCLYNACIY